MNDVLRAARDLQAFCDSQGWPNVIIGGLALLRWGETRQTVDVALTLLTGFGDERKFIEPLLAKYRPRVRDPLAFALANRVVLLNSASGIGLDVALAGLPFEESAVRRATPFNYPGGVVLRTCSAEDLVVLKAFASRPKDWIDVAGILIRNTGRLDWEYIESQLRPLVELKEAPEIMDLLRRKRDEFES